MVRSGNLGDILVRQLSVPPVPHRAHAAGIDEQYLLSTVPEPVVLFVSGYKPQAGGNLRIVE